MAALGQKIDAAEARLKDQRAAAVRFQSRLAELHAEQAAKGEGAIKVSELRLCELQLKSALSGCTAAEAQLAYLELSRRLNRRRWLSWSVFGTAAAAFLMHLSGLPLAKVPGVIAACLFACRIGLAGKDSGARRREQAARLAAAVASDPQYVAYGSGAPGWLKAPVYIACIAAALGVMIWQAIAHPVIEPSVNGFLTREMYIWMLPIAVLAAHGLWLAIAWHLRGRYPDRVIVFANATGIGAADGWVIPYAELERIDPGCSRSKFGTNNWIAIRRKGWRFPTKVDVNMAVDPPDQILGELRDRAIASGAPLEPAMPDGRSPSRGSQLGYRTGYLSGE